MTEFKLAIPCLLGFEGLIADELKRLDLGGVSAENGRVLFSGTARDMAKANVCLRTAERVLVLIGEFKATSFEELFQGVKKLNWEDYLPKNAAFPVKGYCLDSQLHSMPDCQKIIKKAVVERLKQKYGIQWFPEDGPKYQIQFAMMRDRASIYRDTTGAALHKRGWRPEGNAAPLRETLAAAMVKLSRYRGREAFRDPFCGSGTLAIEAALAALNRAPGLDRGFDAQNWDTLPKNIWNDVKQEARAKEYRGSYDIWGGDIDPKCVEMAKNNARRAGVSEYVRFEQADALKFSPDREGGLLVTNPPYGERLLEKGEAQSLYRAFGTRVKNLEGWKKYIISSDSEFEFFFGKKATKKRKLYNGMIKCDLYMYY